MILAIRPPGGSVLDSGESRRAGAQVRRGILQQGRAEGGVRGSVRWQIWPLLGALLGAVLIVLAYQLPARHTVDVGGFDAAYVQGFYAPERTDRPAGAALYLAGGDGAARWSRPRSFLLFPQIGLPAELELRARSLDAPVEVVLRDAHGELSRFVVTPEWQSYRVALRGDLRKPTDVLVVLDAPPTQLPDGRTVGVLLDSADLATSSWPIRPYPLQVAFGALALAFGALLVRLTGAEIKQPLLLGASALALAFVLLYRLQLPYLYPLRLLLPLLNGLLLALLALRLVKRLPQALLRARYADGLALATTGLWVGAVLWAARAHVTLSVPGVEKDFRVYATRDTLATIFQPDGFYNLGYPLLLYVLQPFAPNAFLAAQIASALSGALLLLAGYALVRALLGPLAALLALLVLALSPFVAQYGLYVGSDMPFAALCMLALALLFGAFTPGAHKQKGAQQHQRRPATLSPAYLVALAGCVAGLAFLVRHPGLLLLPFGLLVIAVFRTPSHNAAQQTLGQRAQSAIFNLQAAAFLAGFLLAASPQLVVNTLGTGNPLYSQQAKNIWLGVYGNTDWRNWDEAYFSVPNSISLAEVVLSDPQRFLRNWWGNMRAFWGTGAEDTSEFGRAVQIRLLGFPANWLAVAGLIGILWRGNTPLRLLLLWVALYVAAISTAFVLPRFALPLAPLYALAAAWLVQQALGLIDGHRATRISTNPTGLLGFVAHPYQHIALVFTLLLVVLGPGFGQGARFVLAQQPADEVAAVQLVQGTLGPTDHLLIGLPGDAAEQRLFADVPLSDYSAIAHRVTRDVAQAGYLLSARDDLTTLDGRRLAPVNTAAPGRYRLYQVLP
jgi:hypothetical protein